MLEQQDQCCENCKHSTPEKFPMVGSLSLTCERVGCFVRPSENCEYWQESPDDD